MTAATRHTSPSAFLRQRLERILLVFVVCVPVPTLALSGLAIPLPGVVERVGAALVPWANVATLDTHALAASATGGTIVLTPDQQAAASGVETTEVAAKSAVRTTEAKASRPVATNMRSAVAATQVDTAEPTTPESAPTEPAVPQGGGDEPAVPAPAPTPSPGEPTVGTGKDHGGNGPADPTRPPTVDPAPEPESKDDADVKPVDEPDVKPPDEKGDSPLAPANEHSADSGSTPDLEPDVVATPTADGNGNVNGNGDGGVGNGNGHSNGNGATERGSAK